ncbi:hypothetical protein LCGC14_2276870 [marine sediment metagenome]|uniref:Uncharacterized protein n=1 Tax=marine sediment metagenome TaxID=412755 RepID=A0A0F9CVK1_9ZZZZ
MNQFQNELIKNAIKKLGNDIHLIFLALTLTNKNTAITDIRKGYYKEDHLLNDLNLYLTQKIPKLNSKIGLYSKTF